MTEDSMADFGHAVTFLKFNLPACTAAGEYR